MENQDITVRLEKLAFKKTIPFCYSCYSRAPSGVCARCQSDDLMRELPGEGVEYGVDWVIESLLSENLDSINTDESFEESIRQCYPETTKVGWLELDTVTVLKNSDPISWDMAKSEWLDNELSDQLIYSLDNCTTYYFARDIEQFLDDSESNLVAS